MKVPMMVVMEQRGWLPRPNGVHFDTRVIHHSIVIPIYENHYINNGMNWDSENRNSEKCLIHDELGRMHGNSTVEGGAAISMMHFVNILVQPRIVEDSVWIVTDSFVVEKQGWDRQ